MAVKIAERKLSEAELYAPDLDEGEVDVEHYPLPDAGEIEDPYLAEVWEAAGQLLDQKSYPDEDDEGEDGDEASSDHLEKGLLDSIQIAGKWLAGKWTALEERYGRKATLAMAVAMLATMPLPGTVPAIIAAAEAIRGVRGYFQAEYDGDVEKLKGEAKGETVMDLDPRLTLRFPVNRLRPRDGELK